MAASLRGKTALVTGAGKGIGRAITKRLGGLCEKVFAISRTQADLDSLKVEVVARGMVSRGNGGSIVNVSSITASRTIMNETVYCSSKAALDMFTKCLAIELAPYKIRANNICPGVTKTQMLDVADPDLVEQFVKEKIPLARIIDVEEVVDATVFLLSEHASMITGVSLPVDGGYTAT